MKKDEGIIEHRGVCDELLTLIWGSLDPVDQFKAINPK